MRSFYDYFRCILILPVLSLVDLALKVLASPAVLWPALQTFALIAYRMIRPLKPAYRESLRTHGLSLVASA